MVILQSKLMKLTVLFIVLYLCISTLLYAIVVKSDLELDGILINKIIFIDAGHGGKDNGASVDGVMEDNINLNISEYLYESLLQEGAYVLMSRTNDYDLASMYQKNRKREDLNNRVKYINKSQPDIFISIHLNTYPSNNVKGAQVFYQNNDNSKMLAEYLQNTLNVFMNNKRKVKRGDYFILNNTSSTGVLIECGFLSNDDERSKLNTSQYQQKLSNNIKKGIIDYFRMRDNS